MKFIETNIVKLMVEKIKDWKGYTILEILHEDNQCNIIHYDTLEEFEKDFKLEKSKYYPHEKRLVPQNIITNGRLDIKCKVQGRDHYMHIGESYLAIDGVMYDPYEELKKEKENGKED
jgi:hypothetical protein